MDKKQVNKIDELLDDMSKETVNIENCKSVEDFQKEFFAKVAAQKMAARRKFFRAITTSAALVLCVFVVTSMLWEKRNKTTVSPEEPVLPEVSEPIAETTETKVKSLDLDCVVSAVEAATTFVSNKLEGKNQSKQKRLIPGVKCRAPLELGRYDNFNTEEYKGFNKGSFINTSVSPLSTFGADVDTATYTNSRRYLLQYDELPPKGAVSTEEFLNYFSYDYPKVQGNDIFNVTFESMDAPWAAERKLLLIGVQAKDIDVSDLPNSNFVFLIDNSGSMCNVFPMVIESMETLADQLRPNDRISIVTYGGGVNVLLDGGSGADKGMVKKQLRTLASGGYTPGGAGIIEAYKLAHKHFIKNGNNRVVLITDGDFNVGTSSEEELVELISKERQSAIYLSAFGVGHGNYKDNKLKMLSNKGNGNYSYLDNIREAKRVMTNEMTGKMFTLAKDVKFQIEFNPAKVASYRLIGYELRKLEAQDFNDDSKDSGEVGVGHQVTALYELIMADSKKEVLEKYIGSVDPLKYQKKTEVNNSEDILTFKLRYQQVEGIAPSKLQTFELKSLPKANGNIQWASAVTEFCMLLENCEFKGNANYRSVLKRAKKNLGEDEDGKRAEFLTMVKAAQDLSK